MEVLRSVLKSEKKCKVLCLTLYVRLFDVFSFTLALRVSSHDALPGTWPNLYVGVDAAVLDIVEELMSSWLGP
jgi:hypothetical protein